MESSRESTTPADEGDKYQADGCSRSGTNPVDPPHPTFGFFTLPGTVIVPGTTTGCRQEPIILGSSKVPAKYQ